MNAIALDPETKRNLDHVKALASRAALCGTAWTTKEATRRAREQLAELIALARQVRRELPK